MAGPIIIIGAARSGTKILRDVLAAGPGTARIPYDVNYVWRYGLPDRLDDRLDPGALTARRAGFIRATLPRLAKAGPDDVLVEKTVSNTLRVPFVNAVFPHARFVHLIRDGRDVTESAMRLWQAPPDWRALMTKLRGMPLGNAGYVGWYGWNMLSGRLSGRKGGKVWGPRYPGIEDDVATLPLHLICARQWRMSVEYARADLANIPPERVFNLRYEDFAAGPERVRDLAARLGLADPDAVAGAHRAKVRAEPGGRWADLPEQTRKDIDNELEKTRATLGYQTP